MTPTRPYVSPVRAAASAGKRRDVIGAATRFLGKEGSVARFSLDVIAKDAGVSRLTVYNLFGSRGGLLEAVFDELAQRGRLSRLAGANSDPDPWRGLDHLVDIFCDFWSCDPALGQMQDAGAIDREFGVAVAERNERRRSSIRAIVQRIDRNQPSDGVTDAVDLIFALTSYATFRSLNVGREMPALRDLLKIACKDAAKRGTTKL